MGRETSDPSLVLQSFHCSILTVCVPSICSPISPEILEAAPLYLLLNLPVLRVLLRFTGRQHFFFFFRLTLTETRNGDLREANVFSLLFPALLNFNREAGKGNKVASMNDLEGRSEREKELGGGGLNCSSCRIQNQLSVTKQPVSSPVPSFLFCKTAAARVIRVASREENEKDKKKSLFREKTRPA